MAAVAFSATFAAIQPFDRRLVGHFARKTEAITLRNVDIRNLCGAGACVQCLAAADFL